MGTPEWKIKELDHLEKMWTAKRRSGLSHSKKLWNNIANEWDKDLHENAVRQERSRKRVDTTVEYLIREGALTPDTEVLDIGCGPGRFVAEFAKTAKLAAGLDLSEHMAEYGLKYCEEQGIHNVEFLVEDFKTLDPAEKGLAGRYDLVFSSITPAVGHRDGFLKALSMSKRWFFNAAYISLTDSLIDELDDILGTNSSDPKNSEGFYAMFNEMLLRDYYPQIHYYSEEDTDEYDPDAAMNRYSGIIWNGSADEKQKESLREALRSLQKDDGLLRSHKKWVYGWMLVDKQKAENKGV